MTRFSNQIATEASELLRLGFAIFTILGLLLLSPSQQKIVYTGLVPIWIQLGHLRLCLDFACFPSGFSSVAACLFLSPQQTISEKPLLAEHFLGFACQCLAT